MKTYKFNKIFKFAIVCFTIMLLTSSNVYAHPGRTDSNGCHTCRTNCEKWGLSYGEYHCHNGGRSSNNSYSSNSSNNYSFDYNYNDNSDNYSENRDNDIDLSDVDLIIELNDEEYHIKGGEQFTLNSTDFDLHYRLNTSFARVSMDGPYAVEKGMNTITFTLFASGKTEKRTIFVNVEPTENWLTNNGIIIIGVASVAGIAYKLGRNTNKNISVKK